ncbi:MAG: rhodanese-like domain-containing protein [Thiohalocapsa sp. PB-PSB1]|jgi:thiosulfate/3-mercaptopyruvate sulfurtransferase|nr:MAG: hypothetical protein N838_06545 [Thiohalocapsa sp. PB-PSB1]QQO53592.1 MAG: rhodanese-like domain-containing protein [Thiohalocapsa sp. PB-PSB1]HCS92345.1 rhodanese-like domain-containing protein [Chromatiaceae bacterium]
MRSTPIASICIVLLIGLRTTPAASPTAIPPNEPVSANPRYIDLTEFNRMRATSPAQLTLLDTRPESSCRERSLVGAICLPVEAFFGPYRRLASVRDITWVLGTAGLRGDESVFVFGIDPVRRDAVAALLYLAGQAQVLVLNAPLQHMLETDHHGQASEPLSEPASGRTRGILRDPIHIGPWREHQILLRDELAEQLAQGRIVRLMDGRPLDEYWGERIRARRGGHIPGAEPAPASTLRANLERSEDGLGAETPVVAYAHDPLTGLAYLTLLRAGFGLDAALYLGGWREWADAGQLPADALSYAPIDQAAGTLADQNERNTRDLTQTPALTQSLLTLAALAGAGGFGYLLGRRTT